MSALTATWSSQGFPEMCKLGTKIILSIKGSYKPTHEFKKQPSDFFRYTDSPQRPHLVMGKAGDHI